MKIVKCPTDELALTNRAIVNEQEFDLTKVKHVDIQLGDHHWVITLQPHSAVKPGTIAINSILRKWTLLLLGQQVTVEPWMFCPNQDNLASMVVEIDFLKKKHATREQFDTKKMAAKFVQDFAHQVFSVGQELVFGVEEKKHLSLVVKDLEVIDFAAGEKGIKVNIGVTTANTSLYFEKAENSAINLVCEGEQVFQSIINRGRNFDNMGTSGLGNNNQLSAVLGHALESLLSSPEFGKQLGLPNENQRVQMLQIHTAHMRNNNKLASDINIEELAACTKNFSGAEIEAVVRAAVSTALNRCVKVIPKIEVDQEAAEKVQVTMADFHYALANDVKPACGINEDKYIRNGMIIWSDLVTGILDDIELHINQTRNSETTSLVTLLLEGAPGSGKTAIASYMAKKSDFPFLKICAPRSMIGYHEEAKVRAIKEIFDDAYKSEQSCIILDSIERLLDYTSFGPHPLFSNHVLRALLVHLRETPPHGHKLLVLCTTSCKDVQDLLNTFTKVIHVSNISRPDHLISCLEKLDAFTPLEMVEVHKWISSGRKICIGIKKLIQLVHFAKQRPGNDDNGNRIHKFLSDLEDYSANLQ